MSLLVVHLMKQKITFCVFTLTFSKPRMKVFVSATVRPLHLFIYFYRGVTQCFYLSDKVPGRGPCLFFFFLKRLFQIHLALVYFSY